MSKRKKRSLGFGFTDEIVRVTSAIGLTKEEINEDWKEVLLPNFDPKTQVQSSVNPWRLVSLACFSLILFFAIFLRLFHLQVIEGRHNRELADGNRIQIRIIHAPRGVIYDRNGSILAANSPAFRLFDPDTKKFRLISREEALEFEVKNDPRVANLEIDNVRTYPLKERMAHVVGYVGEISDIQLKNPDFKNYRIGDRIGQDGIEYQYEKILKGIDGGEIIEVDSKGVKLRTLRLDAPVSGQNISLTIDSSLQDKIYQNLQDTLTKVDSCCGGVVAMDPQNGQILALLSLPSYDPNIFSGNGDETAISDILTGSDAPVLNRVIAGTYPPGSTFKIVSSLAALASEKITPQTIVQDNGVIYLGSFKFTNWYFNEYGKTEGPVDLLKALKRSSDTYFYYVGQTIGEQFLGSWAKKLHLGAKLDIDLPGEAPGLVPDDSWKRKTSGESWYPGDTLHMAIGQGFVLTTPLQILGITSFIVSDGILYKPQLILTNFKPKILVSNITSNENIKLIKEGLKLVPKVGGTAWPFFTFPIPTAGKTGTAEYGDSKDRTHAWYTSFAPVDDPKIALTVLVEGGGEGSNVATPIAKEVYRWYFSSDKNNLIKDVYTQATDSGKTLGE